MYIPSIYTSICLYVYTIYIPSLYIHKTTLQVFYKDFAK